MRTTAKEKRYELYKAVKHEVTEYHEDCGYTLVDMWEAVNGKAGIEAQTFWEYECMRDYEHDRKEKNDEKNSNANC